MKFTLVTNVGRYHLTYNHSNHQTHTVADLKKFILLYFNINHISKNTDNLSTLIQISTDFYANDLLQPDNQSLSALIDRIDFVKDQTCVLYLLGKFEKKSQDNSFTTRRYIDCLGNIIEYRDELLLLEPHLCSDDNDKLRAAEQVFMEPIEIEKIRQPDPVKCMRLIDDDDDDYGYYIDNAQSQQYYGSMWSGERGTPHQAGLDHHVKKPAQQLCIEICDAMIRIHYFLIQYFYWKIKLLLFFIFFRPMHSQRKQNKKK